MPADGDGQAADGDGRPPDDQPASGPDRPPQPISRQALFGIFLKAGLAFGGGLGILAVLEQELVTRRQAVGREEFLRLYGLGRIVPSGTMTALAVAYGYRFAGLPGTVISLTALVLPALVLTVALTAVYGLLHQQAWLQELLPVTILPAALAFIVVAGLRLGRDVFRPSRELLLAAAAFAGAAVLHLSPVLLLLAGGVAGTVLFRPKQEDRR
jgi:chromate transporter